MGTETISAHVYQLSTMAISHIFSSLHTLFYSHYPLQKHEWIFCMFALFSVSAFCMCCSVSVCVCIQSSVQCDFSCADMSGGAV